MQPALFAVTGRPVLHSRSPQMLTAAFRAAGLPHSYSRLAADSAEEALEIAAAIGLGGLNVTAPFKERMYELCAAGRQELGRLRAVNTVLADSGQAGFSGFNTDVDGVAQALLARGLRLEGAEVLVLGAGGAARAAVSALAGCGARVTVANRTPEKAARLAQEFGAAFVSLAESEIKTALKQAAIVVSCLGLADRVLPPGLIRKEQVVFDAYYASESALLADARLSGACVVDGREWLLHQGARAFEHFTGKAAPLEAMRDALRAPAHELPAAVALTGFMGSGKSSVAAELARLLRLPCLELDREIESSCGMRISEIFEKQGEERFREIESGILRELPSRGPMVLSCGGGAVLREENRALLGRHYMTVWLWAAAPVILRRLAGDSSRPLLAGRDRAEAVSDLLSRRVGLYHQSSALIVNTERRTPVEIAERIKDEIDRTSTHQRKS